MTAEYVSIIHDHSCGKFNKFDQEFQPSLSAELAATIKYFKLLWR